MKKRFILAILTILFLSLSANSFAKPFEEKNDFLAKERLVTVENYLDSLEHLDSRKINSLFSVQAEVFSTSKGKVKPGPFFSGFFSELKSAKVKTYCIYKGLHDNRRYSARFNFSWIEKSGNTESGEYMDDFVFEENSSKLVKLVMFENKKMYEKTND